MMADGLKGQKHAELEGLLLGEVAKLKKGDFSDEDLKAALVRVKLNQQGIVESNGARVGEMLSAYMTGQNWPSYVARMDRLSKVTKEDVIRVAQKYLGDKYVLVKKIEKKFKPPTMTKPKITPVAIDTEKQSDFAKEVLVIKATPPSAEVLVAGKDYNFDSIKTGPIVTVPNTYNQLFVARWFFEYGSAQAPLICYALDVVKDSGTESASGEQLERQLSLLGSSIDFNCGLDGILISASGLDSNLTESVNFVRTWLSEVKITPDVMTGVLAKIKTSRYEQMNDPRSIGQAAYAYATLGKQSDYLRAPPTAVLEKAKTETLKQSLAKLLTLKSKSSYYGPRDLKAIRNDVLLSSGRVKTKKRAPYVFRKSRKTQVFYTDQETAQAQILFGWPKGKVRTRDRAVGSLMNNYVGGGMGGLLFQEIREARGLAYSVSGWYAPGERKNDESSMGAYIGTQSDKTKDAMNTLVEVLARPIDDKRLAQAKSAMEATRQSERTPPRSIAARVYAWKDRGVNSDPRAKEHKAAMKVSDKTLASWLKKTLKNRAIISVVGPSKSIDQTHLSTFGKVEQVPVEKIFNY